jgi:hypothetical protein
MQLLGFLSGGARRVRILNNNVEHFGEVLTQAMRGTTLNGTTSGGDESLDSSSVQTTSKSFLLGLDTLHNRKSKVIGVNLGIQIQDLTNFNISFLLGQVSSVTFLPQELASTKERLRVLEFPSNNRAPLVDLQGQITMGSDPLGKVRIHDSFGGRANSNGLFQIVLSCSGDPSDFRSETFNMILLSLQNLVGNKHGEVSIFYTHLNNSGIEKV